jgi:hypothetical protein
MAWESRGHFGALPRANEVKFGSISIKSHQEWSGLCRIEHAPIKLNAVFDKDML